MQSRKRGKSKTKAAGTKRPWILGSATLLGTFLAIVTFLPRPVVSVGDPVDPNNPFSVTFTTTNTTMIPLHHVNIYYALGEVDVSPLPFTPVSQPNFEEYGVKIIKPEWKDHTLGMDERFTITLTDAFLCCKPGLPVQGAELGIIVEYNPWVLPWKREKTFAFVTHRQSNGELYWYSVPDR
jgi:hypothetical protein